MCCSCNEIRGVGQISYYWRGNTIEIGGLKAALELRNSITASLLMRLSKRPGNGEF